MEEDPYDPEPVGEGDIQMEYSSDCLCSPSTRAITKYYLQELWSAEVPLDNLEYSVIQHLSCPVQLRLMEFCCICNSLSMKYFLSFGFLLLK